jgi:hypothetical protein
VRPGQDEEREREHVKKGIPCWMTLSWPAMALTLLLLISCDRPPAPADQVHPASPQKVLEDRSIPGGGRILFLPSRAPGYEWHGIGILEADGSTQWFPADHLTFPYWDPADSTHVLAIPHGGSRTRSFEVVAESLRLVGSWRTSDFMTLPSTDGGKLAYTPVARSGRPRYDVIRLVDRSSGTTRTLRSGGLVPLEWTPDGRLLAAPQRGGDLVLWNPTSGVVTPFGSHRLSGFSWAPDGRRFAAVIVHDGEDPAHAVVIGAPGGRIVDRVSTRRLWVEMPTWSPDGGRIAFIVRGPEPRGHRTATLHVYDIARRIHSVVARSVSDAFWASWSPDGRWLLLADWTRNRWLFVAADGSERRPYPWLGAFPRWCCPSSPGWVPIPAS